MSVPKLYETARPQKAGPESPTEPRFFSRRGIKSHDTPRGPTDSDAKVPGIRPTLAQAEPRLSSLYKRKPAAVDAKDREATAAKFRPARIRQDKEQLYEDSLALKMENNGLRNENLRLRTRLNQLEKDIARKDDFLEELRGLSEERQFSSVLAHSHLVAGLKQANRDLRVELANKEGEFEKLKRLSKLTKLTEMETELRVYVEECQRLKDCLLDTRPSGPHDSALQSQLFEARQEAERFRRLNMDLEAQTKTQDLANEQLAEAQGEIEDLQRQLGDLEQRKRTAVLEYANEMEELYKERTAEQATAKKAQLLLGQKEKSLLEVMSKVQSLEMEVEEERGEKEKIKAQISTLRADIVEKGDLLRLVILKTLKRKLEHAGISASQALNGTETTISGLKAAFRAQGVKVKAWQLQALATIMDVQTLAEDLERVEVRAQRKIKAPKEPIREISAPPKPIPTISPGAQISIFGAIRRQSSESSSSKHSEKPAKKSSSSSRKSSISDHEAFATAVKPSDPPAVKTEKDLFRTDVDMSLSKKSSSSSDQEPARDRITPFEAESAEDSDRAATPPIEEAKAYLEEPEAGAAQGSSIDDLNEREEDSFSIPVGEVAEPTRTQEDQAEGEYEGFKEINEAPEVLEEELAIPNIEPNEEEKAHSEAGFSPFEREEEVSSNPEFGSPKHEIEESVHEDEFHPVAEESESAPACEQHPGPSVAPEESAPVEEPVEIRSEENEFSAVLQGTSLEKAEVEGSGGERQGESREDRPVATQEEVFDPQDAGETPMPEGSAPMEPQIMSPPDALEDLNPIPEDFQAASDPKECSPSLPAATHIPPEAETGLPEPITAQESAPLPAVEPEERASAPSRKPTSEMPRLGSKTLSDLPSPQAEKALKRMRLSLLASRIGKSQLTETFLQSRAASTPLEEAELGTLLGAAPFSVTEDLEALLQRLGSRCQTWGEAALLLNEDLPGWEVLSKTQEDIRNQQLLQLFTHAPDLLATGEISSDMVSLDSFEILMLKYGFRLDPSLRLYIEYLSFLETRQIDCVPYPQLRHAFTTQQAELTASTQAISWTFSGSQQEALAKECALLLSNRLIELNLSLRTAFQARIKEEMTLEELEVGLKSLGLEENCGVQSQALVGETGRIAVDRLEALLVHFGAYSQGERAE